MLQPPYAIYWLYKLDLLQRKERLFILRFFCREYWSVVHAMQLCNRKQTALNSPTIQNCNEVQILIGIQSLGLKPIGILFYLFCIVLYWTNEGGFSTNVNRLLNPMPIIFLSYLLSLFFLSSFSFLVLSLCCLFFTVYLLCVTALAGQENPQKPHSDVFKNGSCWVWWTHGLWHCWGGASWRCKPGRGHFMTNKVIVAVGKTHQGKNNSERLHSIDRRKKWYFLSFSPQEHLLITKICQRYE